jgi:alpha-galactosidase
MFIFGRSNASVMTDRATQTEQPIDPSDTTIAYVGGGSRQWAPNLIRDLALSNFDGHVRLYDTNVEAAELNADFGNWVQEDPDATAEWSYEAVEDIGDALAGADVVIDRKSTRLNSSHVVESRMPSSA